MNKLQLNLSGGMNRKTAPLIIKDEECELAVNVDLDRVGAVEKRKGYSTTHPTIPGTGAINGLSSNIVNNGSVYWYAARNRNVYVYHHGWSSWISRESTLNSTVEKVRFASFVDRTFRVVENTEMQSSFGQTSFGDTQVPDDIEPRYIEVFTDRVYVASNSDEGAESSRVYFSSLPDNDSISWDTDNDWFDVNPDDGDEITALANNGNRLLIFKNRALYRWTFGQVEPDKLIGVGTTSQESVKTNLDVGITFFANPHGVYAYSGGRPKLLSRKIQDVIDAVSDWEDVVAEIDIEHYYLAVGNITLEGREYQNCVLVYHISLDAWSMFTFAHPVNIMARLPDNDGITERVYFGSDNGKVYELWAGDSDDGAPIQVFFRSKEYLISYPYKVELDRVDVFAQNRGTGQVFIDNDRNNDFIPLGPLEDRVTPLRASKGDKLNSIRLLVSDNSTNPLMIEGFNFEYEDTLRRDEGSKEIA